MLFASKSLGTTMVDLFKNNYKDIKEEFYKEKEV
jgi:hypothetical protein